MNKYILKIALLLLTPVIILSQACKKKEAEKTPPIVRPVKTTVVSGFREGEFTFPGRVEAGRKLVMSFRVQGRLISLPIKEGQDVSKGTLIGRLDPKDYQIAVDEAKARFTKTEADYDRYKTLYEKNAVPLADLDLRRSQRDVAAARLEEARKNFGYTYLRAPFDGTIGNRYVENHMDIKAQEKVVDLNDTTTVEIKINAPESLVSGLQRLEDKVDVKMYSEFETKADKKYDLRLKEISGRADEQTQTFEVTFEMGQPDDIQLLPGMTSNVRIVMTLKEGATLDLPISIPAIAVLGGAKGDRFVWIVIAKTMTVQKAKVNVGSLRGTSELEIKSGLKGGERIVTAGLLQLQEGMKVRLWEEQDK